MVLTRRETILMFEDFKKKFGHIKEFKDFEEKHASNIKLIKFVEQHGLKHYKKTGWNKLFFPIIEQVWIKDKKNYHKGLKKYGYYQSVITGWKLGDSFKLICKWCGILLKDRKTSCCSNIHKTYYHRVLKKGKELYEFDITKNNHILLIPRLWHYEINKNGHLEKKELRKENIHLKEIEFSINGKRHLLTTKSRTPSKQKLT